ncbi:hypothetical protein DBR36_03295 [Microbacterium sp. HMWF026]|nr:hypothetical protein DBR36_03295 [Microbacterium sp. HMWF026]
MTDHLETARFQANMIAEALDGESASMQSIGRTERDANAIRTLAVGLAHAHNAFHTSTSELEQLRRKRR